MELNRKERAGKKAYPEKGGRSVKKNARGQGAKIGLNERKKKKRGSPWSGGNQ